MWSAGESTQTHTIYTNIQIYKHTKIHTQTHTSTHRERKREGGRESEGRENVSGGEGKFMCWKGGGL